GVGDNLSDGDQSYAIRIGSDNTTADLRYRNLEPADVLVENLDLTATAGFFVSAVSGDTSEGGGTASFSVRLRSEPTANVTVSAASSDAGEGKVSPDNLSFTSSNWKSWQLLTVTGQPDNLSDGDQSYAIRLLQDNTTTDLDYRFRDPPDVSLRNLDLASGGYYVSVVSGDTDESGTTQNFTVRLRSAPTASVTLTLESTDTGEGTIKTVNNSTSNTDRVSFTKDNWNSAQVVVVKGVGDNLSDGDQSYAIRIGSDNTTADLRYRFRDPPDVSLRNLDLASGGYYVSAVSGDTDESGTTQNFTVRLRSAPTASVTLTLESTDTGEGTIKTVNNSTSNTDRVSFTKDNWNSAQVVVVKGVGDNLSDGDQSYAIRIGSDNTTADLRYRNLEPADVLVENLDLTATAGFFVSAVSGDTSEVGGTASFSVRLRSEPTANVTVSAASSDAGEGKVSPD
ncbi:MAG: hypothetical protein ABGX49_03240, partial [Candidatus Poseidoniia archaeon]